MTEPILVIMAAGIGSRFGGLKQIESVDKEGHKIIDFSLYDAFRAGFRRVIFIIDHAIENDFKAAIGLRMEKIFEVKYIFQELNILPKGYSVPEGRKKPWGTAHAIYCAKEEIDAPFAVINADDYYGIHAIAEIFKFLKEEKSPTEHAMVGYPLKNTLTDSGYVSRGICKVENGYLKDIVERVHIEKRPDGTVSYTEDKGNYFPLSLDDIVSMNLWGFRKEILFEFASRFSRFLDENISKNPLKCEYYLPFVADRVVKERLGSIRVLSTEDRWHGVTYRRDIYSVMDAMTKMKKKGLYPEKLWLKIPAIYHFKINGAPFSLKRHGKGHIHDTYILETSIGKRYILQRISDIFDVKLLMENIEAVTAFASSKTKDPRTTLKLIKTTDRKSFYTDETGNYRMYELIEDVYSLERPRSSRDFYEAALAFGNFEQLMSDFPIEKLNETIKNFHNTKDRYRIFKETLEKDPCNRRVSALKEIQFALNREKEAGILENMKNNGKLPLRVTHNDTKLNNVLLDKTTGKALSVVDLDTVMPGLSAYDFGDAIRFGAATAAEDEEDLSKITIDLGLFRAFTRGYLQACPDLTKLEIDVLPMGAKIMTLECGVRFLTDYLDGDHYFLTSRAGQNLSRARTQFKLVSEMEKHWDEMKNIVNEERSK